MNPKDQIINLLNQLAEARGELAEIAEPYEAKLDELHAQYIAPVIANRDEAMEEVQQRVNDLDMAIRAIGREYGHSVSGNGLQLVYSKGSATWDKKALDTYIDNLDDDKLRDTLLEMKTRTPSVSIRKVSTVRVDTSAETKDLFG